MNKQYKFLFLIVLMFGFPKDLFGMEQGAPIGEQFVFLNAVNYIMSGLKKAHYNSNIDRLTKVKCKLKPSAEIDELIKLSDTIEKLIQEIKDKIDVVSNSESVEIQNKQFNIIKEKSSKLKALFEANNFFNLNKKIEQNFRWFNENIQAGIAFGSSKKLFCKLLLEKLELLEQSTLSFEPIVNAKNEWNNNVKDLVDWINFEAQENFFIKNNGGLNKKNFLLVSKLYHEDKNKDLAKIIIDGYRMIREAYDNIYNTIKERTLDQIREDLRPKKSNDVTGENNQNNTYSYDYENLRKKQDKAAEKNSFTRSLKEMSEEKFLNKYIINKTELKEYLLEKFDTKNKDFTIPLKDRIKMKALFFTSLLFKKDRLQKIGTVLQNNGKIKPLIHLGSLLRNNKFEDILHNKASSVFYNNIKNTPLYILASKSHSFIDLNVKKIKKHSLLYFYAFAKIENWDVNYQDDFSLFYKTFIKNIEQEFEQSHKQWQELKVNVEKTLPAEITDQEDIIRDLTQQMGPIFIQNIADKNEENKEINALRIKIKTEQEKLFDLQKNLSNYQKTIHVLEKKLSDLYNLQEHFDSIDKRAILTARKMGYISYIYNFIEAKKSLKELKKDEQVEKILQENEDKKKQIFNELQNRNWSNIHALPQIVRRYLRENYSLKAKTFDSFNDFIQLDATEKDKILDALQAIQINLENSGRINELEYIKETRDIVKYFWKTYKNSKLQLTYTQQWLLKQEDVLASNIKYYQENTDEIIKATDPRIVFNPLNIDEIKQIRFNNLWPILKSINTDCAWVQGATKIPLEQVALEIIMKEMQQSGQYKQNKQIALVNASYGIESSKRKGIESSLLDRVQNKCNTSIVNIYRRQLRSKG